MALDVSYIFHATISISPIKTVHGTMGVVETVSPGSYKIFFVVRNLTLCHWLIIFLNIIFSIEARVCIWYIGFRLLDWQRQSPRPHSKRWELNYDLAISHWHCYRDFLFSYILCAFGLCVYSYVFFSSRFLSFFFFFHICWLWETIFTVMNSIYTVHALFTY